MWYWRMETGCRRWNQSFLLEEFQKSNQGSKEGYAFAGEGELGVVLETTITPELKEEGYLREILSKVQNMRKDRDFEVLDRINLYFANWDTIKAVIEKYKDQIMKDTLADKIFYNEKRENYVETKINDATLDIDVEVVK